jgi:hypothetical protein
MSNPIKRTIANLAAIIVSDDTPMGTIISIAAYIAFATLGATHFFCHPAEGTALHSISMVSLILTILATYLVLIVAIVKVTIIIVDKWENSWKPAIKAWADKNSD